MKRRICSCDMAEVPGDCYVLREEAGEMSSAILDVCFFGRVRSSRSQTFQTIGSR